MPTYEVNIPITGSFSATVEADDPEEAKEIATGRGGGLCAACSGYFTSDYDPADTEGDGPWSLSLDDITTDDAEVNEVTR